MESTQPPIVEPEPVSQPSIDVIDNTDEIWVFVDLPGFSEEEIRVRGDQNTLVVSAERPNDLEEGRNVLVTERPSRVERTIPLPASTRTSRAKASFEDGVCKVTLPKAATDRYEEIEIGTD